MTYLRYTLLGLLLLLAVTVALANRTLVTLALWPDTVASLVGFGSGITLPLFVVVVGAVGIGLLMGLIWEWLRERSVRAEAARLRRELDALRARLPAEGPVTAAPAPQDEILALVDGRRAGA